MYLFSKMPSRLLFKFGIMSRHRQILLLAELCSEYTVCTQATSLAILFRSKNLRSFDLTLTSLQLAPSASHNICVCIPYFIDASILLVRRKLPSHSLSITRDTNNGDRKKSSGHPTSLHSVGRSEEAAVSAAKAGAAQLQAILATLAAGFSQITHDLQPAGSVLEGTHALSLWLLGVTLSQTVKGVYRTDQRQTGV